MDAAAEPATRDRGATGGYRVSGLIDFERETAVSDVPLEYETGVTSTAWSPGLTCNDVGIVLGLADVQVVPKDS